MQSNLSCSVEGIKNLEETKFYTVFANSILEALTNAVQNKALKPISALVWITLKMEVNLKNPEWSIKKSIRTIKDQFGISKSNAETIIKELEEGGYIEIDRSQRNLSRLAANTIKVRFPNSGIKLANLAPNRTKIIELKTLVQVKYERESNKLSTEVSQKTGHACPEIKDNIKNTNNKILENNKGADLSTDKNLSSEPLPPAEFVDCCLAMPVENKKNGSNFDCEQDSSAEEINTLEKRIEKNQIDEKKLAQQWCKNPSDTKTFSKWQKSSSVLAQSKVKLDILQAQRFKKTAGQGGCVAIIGKKMSKRVAPIVLTKMFKKEIRQKLDELRASRLLTNPREVARQFEYQLSCFKVGETLGHGLNILLIIVKKGTFKIPGGYTEYCIKQNKAA